MKKDFLSILDWTPEEIRSTLQLAKQLKIQAKQGAYPKYLENKSYALIFHKNSLRTRVSFEVGIAQLGGHSLYLNERDFEIGKREAIGDVAKVLSRYVDGILIRTYSHQDVVELASQATVPVVNMLTDWSHPCQILADVLTIEEQLGSIENVQITYLGDGNNVTNSWINLASKIPFHLCIATAPETLPDKNLIDTARKKEISKISIVHSAEEGVKNADVLYTDVWASMGEKEKRNEKIALLQKFQINGELLNQAKPNAIVLHCLPAERGYEITDEVLDGPQSFVLDQAENRMHAHKAILVQLERWRNSTVKS